MLNCEDPAKLAPRVAVDRDLAAWANRFDMAVPRDVLENGLSRGVVLGGEGGARIAIGP